MSPPNPPDEAVASLFPVKLYLLHVPLPETEPDLIQSQIRFFFLYRKNSWNYAREWGQFQLLFLCDSIFTHEAAADNGRSAGIGNPIVQS